MNFLMFNRSRNYMVPAHKIMSQKEIEEYVTPYFQEIKLITIKLGDPQVMYLGGELDDIFQIGRKTETSGISTIYRRVIS